MGETTFAPYDLTVGKTESLELVLFGNRVNTFGAVHMVGEDDRFLNPGSWRTQDDGWSEEYVLQKVGNFVCTGDCGKVKMYFEKQKCSALYSNCIFCFLTRNRECATMIKRCRIKRLSLIYEEAHVSLALSTLAS